MRFLGSFVFPLSIPLLYAGLSAWGPLLTPAAMAALLLGAEFVAPRGPASGSGAGLWMAYALVPVQLGMIAWATHAATTASSLGFASLVFAVGVTTGVFGVLAAHDLVHGQSSVGRLVGATMLTGMCYRHFRIAHLYGHHRYACTDRDPATARLGEGFYSFLARTLVGQWLEALRFEQRRSANALWRNRVVQDFGITTAVVAALAFAWGPRSALFFLAQSAVAIIVLELFNYIAHYGLTRECARMGAEHSWNSSNVIANAFLFNMGRHSDHHAHPAAPFDTLTYAPGAPELPAGYAGAILMALVPPLWRRVMDSRVLALRAQPMRAAA
ncbi:MAG: alkane 1-monooxygenase [Pseudomonadota bacterium]